MHFYEYQGKAKKLMRNNYILPGHKVALYIPRFREDEVQVPWLVQGILLAEAEPRTVKSRGQVMERGLHCL